MSVPAFVIRPIQAAEVFIAAKIASQAFNEAAQSFVPSLKAAVKTPSDTIALTATLDGEIVGLVTATRVDYPGRKTLSHLVRDYPGVLINIKNLAVVETARGRGIAKSLMSEVEAAARLAWKIKSDTEGYFYLNQDPAGFPSGERFYQKQSYIVVDRCAPRYGANVLIKAL